MIRKFLLRLTVASLLVLLALSPVFAGTGIDYTDPNCVGAWLLDVNEDPQTDSSGQGNTGAVFGADYNVDGKFDACYNFILANNDYIDIGEASDLDFGTGNFSVIMWIRATTTSVTDQKIITKDDTDDPTRIIWAMQVEESDDAIAPNNATFLVFNTGTSDRVYSMADVNDSNWHHLAGVRDGTNLIFYFEGVNVDTDTDTSVNVTNANANVWMGGGENSGHAWYGGKIDDVGAFNDDLDSTEVNDIMDNGLAGAVVAVGKVGLIGII